MIRTKTNERLNFECILYFFFTKLNFDLEKIIIQNLTWYKNQGDDERYHWVKEDYTTLMYAFKKKNKFKILRKAIILMKISNDDDFSKAYNIFLMSLIKPYNDFVYMSGKMNFLNKKPILSTHTQFYTRIQSYKRLQTMRA